MKINMDNLFVGKIFVIFFIVFGLCSVAYSNVVPMSHRQHFMQYEQKLQTDNQHNAATVSTAQPVIYPHLNPVLKHDYLVAKQQVMSDSHQKTTGFLSSRFSKIIATAFDCGDNCVIDLLNYANNQDDSFRLSFDYSLYAFIRNAALRLNLNTQTFSMLADYLKNQTNLMDGGISLIAESKAMIMFYPRFYNNWLVSMAIIDAKVSQSKLDTDKFISDYILGLNDVNQLKLALSGCSNGALKLIPIDELKSYYHKLYRSDTRNDFISRRARGKLFKNIKKRDPSWKH